MARSDWVYVGFDKPLIEEVDRVVASVLIHGAPKYTDRKHFLQTAVQKLLSKETKEVEVSA